MKQSSSRKIPAILFDMDGLMFDTEAIAKRAWTEVLHRYGYALTEDLWSQFAGTAMSRKYEIIPQWFGESAPVIEMGNLRLEIGDSIEEKEGLPVKKGLLELLDFLESQNIRKAIVTGTDRARAIRRLDQLQLTARFEFLVTSDETSKSKPAPDGYLQALELLGTQSQECFVLEDSEAGVISASTAKIPVLLVPDTKEPAPEVASLCLMVFRDLCEVQFFLEKKFCTK